jgi:sulfur carrier protein
MSILIRLNGEAQETTARDLAALLADLQVEKGAKGVAVARNGEVVPKSEWGRVALAVGDEIEVVKLFAGG